MINLTVQFRSAGLEVALARLSENSKRLPSYLVNKACYSIALKAEKAMPVVLPAKMDTELNVTMAPSAKSKAKNPKKVVHLAPRSRAALIVVASMHPGSKYNIRTGHVFARQMISPEKTKGSVERFWRQIDVIAKRMVRARHSSSGFFRLGASVVKFIFKGALRNVPLQLSEESGEVQAGGGNVSKRIGKVAGGLPASGDQTKATARFWVATTEPDTKGLPGRALYTIIQPVWERAVDAEAASIRAYAETLYAQTARDSGLLMT